jgi:hypothetical protein
MSFIEIGNIGSMASTTQFADAYCSVYDASVHLDRAVRTLRAMGATDVARFVQLKHIDIVRLLDELDKLEGPDDEF